MMNKIKFSIGYNQKKSFLSLLTRFRERIESVYFPIPSSLANTGRFILQNDDYREELLKVLSVCKNLRISTLLLMNAICDRGDGLADDYFDKISDFIHKLRSLGLSGIVLTNPLHMLRVKKEFPGLIVESSVNCFVDTPEHAKYLKEYGADIVTIDRDINRNIDLIKKIKTHAGVKIKIVLNEGCLKNCPLRVWHFNYLSHSDSHFADVIQKKFLDKYCLKTFKKKPELFLKIPFVPPDELHRYAGIVDYFKLSTRALSTPKIINCLLSYGKQDFDGNILDILDGPALSPLKSVNYARLKKKGYFEKMLKCNNDCLRCGFCQRLAKEVVLCD